MATISQVQKYYANQRKQKLRELLRRDSGKYRITKYGEIHAYGKMPNSIETGWWLVGRIESVEYEYGL